MVKVSVVVPVYNVEEYVAKCLDSLVNQTLKDIEIIVVNDGSPDNSQEIIDEYVKKYKNVKSYIKKNGGLSDARNYGLKYAKGEYISFIDSDDYVDIHMMEKMYNKANKEKLDIVVCDSVEIHNEKNILKRSNLHYSNDDIKNYIISPPMAWSRLYRKNVFENIKFTKGIYYEDLDFTPSLVKLTSKIGFVEEGLYYYIQRDNSIMRQKKYNDKLLDIFKVLEKNKELLYNDYSEEIEYLYITHLLRTATLRFLDYEEYNELIDKVIYTMRNNFPNYSKNIYYKKSSYKLKIVCNLAYHKRIKLLRVLKKYGGM